MSINEATLEARVDHLLKEIFPTFNKIEIEHQTSFSLKFGHRDISIDGKEPIRNYARAISDIIIKQGSQNLMLLELKKESLVITQDDIEQGLSYGRLIDPMPPITLISNGKDHFFYETYTKKEIKDAPPDLKSIQALINTAFKLAIKDTENAIEVLMNGDVEIIMQILNSLTAKKLDSLTGPVTDFTKPLSGEFSIDREIVKTVFEATKVKNVIGLIGDAFSGKTNVLSQLFKNHSDGRNGFFYLDCQDYNYSLFQNLANNFSRTFGFAVNKDRVRQWLITSLRHNETSRIIIIVDNLSNTINADLLSDMLELIDIFNGSRNVILFSANTWSFKKIKTKDHRSYNTSLGEVSSIIKLKGLSNTEFRIAQSELWRTNRAAFQHGADKTAEYREPGILRQISALYKTESKSTLEEGQGMMIMAIPNFAFLEHLSKTFLIPFETRELFKKYGAAFIEEAPKRAESAYLNIAASGTGALTVEAAKKTLGQDFENFMSSGLVNVRELHSAGQVLFPKIPEVVSYFAIPLIQEKVELAEDVDRAYEIYMNLCNPLPFSDIVGSQILYRILTKGNTALFRALVSRLLKHPPKKEAITKGTKTLGYYEDISFLELNFVDNMEDQESNFIADPLPYLILSQFLTHPFEVLISDDEPSLDQYLNLIEKVGSVPIPMARTYALPFKGIQSLSTHNFDKFGEVVCESEGIVEPISQSVNFVFRHHPDMLTILYKKAIKEDNLPLLWRINIALQNEENNVDPEIAKKATIFMRKYRRAFKDIFPEIITQHIKDPAKKKQIISKLKKRKGTRK